MLHLEAEWTSKQNILIADTILAEPGPWTGFKVWGEYTCLGGKYFYSYRMFKTIFLSTTKFGGAHKKCGGKVPPNAPPCLRARAEPSPESLPLGAFMFVEGARHSENLFLIHNMNSICILCKLIINILSKIPTIGS